MTTADKIHVDDLTTNCVAFGLLDDDTMRRLRKWPHGLVGFSSVGRWEPVPYPSWTPNSIYRAVPAPAKKPSVDWSHVGPAVNHFATDADGRVRAYDIIPECEATRWICIGGFYTSRADRLFPSYKPGTVDWTESLISRPGVEE